MKTIKKERSTLQKVIIGAIKLLALAALLFLISYVCTYLIWCKFANHKIIWDLSLIQSKIFNTVAILIALALCGIAAYTLIKYNIISFSKIVNKVERAKSDAYGSTRWQTENEMHENYGYYKFNDLPNIEAEGLVISSEIKKGDLYVSMIAKQHTATVGTPGTGKSLYLLGPTLQANAKTKTKVSMVINDLKGELYTAHSKMLADSGYDVIKIDLRNPHTSDRYNPLSLIWDLYHTYLTNHDGQYIDRVSVYINELANILCPISEGEQKQWSQGAQSIIKSIIWGMLEDSQYPEFKMTRDKFTILQISNIINRQRGQLINFLTHRNKTSPVFDFAGMIVDNPSEKTVGSYYATLSTALEGFLEEGLQKVTSATDVDISNLAKRPTAMFVIIPDELKTRNIVGTMIFSQLYNYLTFEASQNPNERLDKNVYFFLDEFGNLPKIPNFDNWVAMGRSRGIFFNIILQADSQLDAIYGADIAKNIMQSCQVQILLGASELGTLKRFEELLGKYTIYQRSANVDQTNASIEYKGSTSLTSKELVTLDELQRIPRGTIYFKVVGSHPCKAHLVPLFDEAAKHIFIRGALTEKGSGRRIELDKTAMFYDLQIRESIIMQVEEELRQNTTPKNPKGVDGKAAELYNENQEDTNSSILVEVEFDLFEAVLKPHGFEMRANSYNSTTKTCVVIIPQNRQQEAARLMKSPTDGGHDSKPGNQNKKNIDFIKLS